MKYGRLYCLFVKQNDIKLFLLVHHKIFMFDIILEFPKKLLKKSLFIFIKIVIRIKYGISFH